MSKEEVSKLIEDLEGSKECTRRHEFDRYIRDVYLFINHFGDENIKVSLEDEPAVEKQEYAKHCLNEEDL